MKKPYLLQKYSSPGWEKYFETKDELVDELRSHICRGCRIGPQLYVGEGGQLVEGDDDWNPVVDVEYDGVYYPCRDIGTLLSTSCGCEYGVEIDGKPYWED